MSNISINQLPTASTIDATQDIIPIYTASSLATQGISRNTLLGLSSGPVGLTDSQTLTNKILTSPTINGATLSGTLSGTYTLGGTPTFPSSVVTLTGSQTLTNKVLTSPTINSPTITNATISADAVTGFSVSNTGTIYGISVTTGTIGNAALAANSVNTSQLAANSVTTAKLATGSNFTPVTVMQNPYKFSVYRNAAQNTTNGAFTKVNFDTKLFDTGGNYDAITNFRFTAPIAGFYQFNWGSNTASVAATDFATALYKNGTTFQLGQESFPSTSNASVGSALVQAAANDYFEIWVFYNSTQALQVGSSPIRNYFSGFLVSAT